MDSLTDAVRRAEEREIVKAACVIAVRCRHVIQGLLRDEEMADCDREFSDIAEAVIRELSTSKGK